MPFTHRASILIPDDGVPKNHHDSLWGQLKRYDQLVSGWLGEFSEGYAQEITSTTIEGSSKADSRDILVRSITPIVLNAQLSCMLAWSANDCTALKLGQVNFRLPDKSEIEYPLSDLALERAEAARTHQSLQTASTTRPGPSVAESTAMIWDKYMPQLQALSSGDFEDLQTKLKLHTVQQRVKSRLTGVHTCVLRGREQQQPVTTDVAQQLDDDQLRAVLSSFFGNSRQQGRRRVST
jgi:hypothetical protein